MKTNENYAFSRRDKRALRLWVLAAAAIPFTMPNMAAAFEIPTENADIAMRWDNTLRYNFGQRVEPRNAKLAATSRTDDGDQLFDKGDTITNRLDVLSEFDFAYKDSMGFRVSAAAWYDDAYGDNSKTNPASPSSSNYDNNRFSSYVKRYYHGPSGEILDAFVFGKFNLGDMPTTVKVGQHTIYWGESLFGPGLTHSVAYSQMPVDLQKSFANPGVEAKELFMPLNNISLQTQASQTVSVAAQYFLDWKAYHYPEGGTYLGPADFAFNGPDKILLPTGLARRVGPNEPDKRGDYGVAVRWSPEWLKGTLGFYYRNFSDKTPQILRVTSTNTYLLSYADDIDLYGLSLTKNIAGMSLGAEVSYRRNMQLLTPPLYPVPTMPQKGEASGARGNTWHALLNMTGVIPKTSLFDIAAWGAELTYSRWDKVTQNPNAFNALGFTQCVGKDKWDGCATKDFYGTTLVFTPTWFNVFPSIDISMPVTYSVGLRGNAAVLFGGNEGTGNYSIGIGADIYQKYRVDLKYVDYIGHLKESATQITAQNGLTALLVDRGYWALTIKMGF